MVGKYMAINPLTIEERYKVKEGLDMNMSYSELGRHVGRPKSTVLRESKRLGHAFTYDPQKAQEDFENKQKNILRKNSS